MTRTDVLRMRVTELEKAAFEEAAQMAGVSFSTWARTILRRAALREFQDAGRRLDLYPPSESTSHARNSI
jgi:DNA-directed RNA polymerase specialized sigma24 family protein